MFCSRSQKCSHQDEKLEGSNSITRKEGKGSFASRPIEPECETKKVPLDLSVPNKIVVISQDLASSEETELLSFLDKNDDVFTWKTFDLMAITRHNRAQATGQALCKTQEAKASQNVRREGGGSKNRGSNTLGRRVHT
jgi:hypothetical protein